MGGDGMLPTFCPYRTNSPPSRRDEMLVAHSENLVVSSRRDGKAGSPRKSHAERRLDGQFQTNDATPTPFIWSPPAANLSNKFVRVLR